MDDLDLKVELSFETDERDHDLRSDFDPLFHHLGSSLEHGAGLHLRDFRIDQPQPVAAKAQHGVELVQLLYALANLLHFNPHFLRQQVLRSMVVRQEFVQRRVEEADRRRRPLEFRKDSDEVCSLKRQQLGQRPFPVILVLGQNHLAHDVDTISLEEHVLGAAESYAGGAEGDRIGSLLRGIGIRAHLQARGLAAPIHQFLEHLIGRALLCIEGFFNQNLHDLRGGRRQRAGINFTSRPINRQSVALPENGAVHSHCFGGVIDLQGAGAADADLPHLAGDQRCVRADAALGREDALGCDHATKIFG